ncbi:MAG: hypothetical protein ACD_16C00002G0003 [uncultured bacterium]|nr:MAG: hypothetical protein ACD_16C00002G0003 [uncultured bacterium]
MAQDKIYILEWFLRTGSQKNKHSGQHLERFGQPGDHVGTQHRACPLLASCWISYIKKMGDTDV